MRTVKMTAAAALLLLFGAAGCADLDVANPNDPTRDQALASATDVESLIAGSYNSWYNGLHHYFNTFWLSNASFQSASTAANWSNVDFAQIPREEVINDPAYSDYEAVVARAWNRSYRALAAVADGIRTLDNDPEMGEALDDQTEHGELRVRTIGKTMQALGHATIAVWYDQGFVADETTDLSGELVPVSYDEVMDAAYGYFDEAIALAESDDFTIPAQWMSRDVPSSQLVEMLHSWRAIFRASLPRYPDDPVGVDWNAVLDDLDQGLTSSFVMNADWTSIWYNGAFDVTGGPNGWGADTYFIIGMADQSGDYQRWVNTPLPDRTAWFGGAQDQDPFLIQTPDTRFPTGATIAEQIANPGEYYVIPTADAWDYNVSDHFTNPSRGTWRWSYYYYPRSWDYWFGVTFDVPLITIEEINLLRAEAMLALGNAEDAASIINMTRTAHGLNATDESGTNTSCVPRLPSGVCGDLMEMLKWEKRLETRNVGLFNVSWFWDGRRWGDLYRGTALQLPVPAGELATLQLESYTFGGVGESPPSASAGSSYDFPGEN